MNWTNELATLLDGDARGNAERQRDSEIESDADRLTGKLSAFVRSAWPFVWPNESYVHGWHIDAICDHLEAVTRGEIRRLQIWVPPGSSKSTVVSIMWPAWEWTHAAWLRYITASYDAKLAERFAQKSRELIRHPWYQERWPHVRSKRDMDRVDFYANTAGGERLATSPAGTGTGVHAHRIVIDDPLNAREVTSEAALTKCVDWHDGTLATRFVDPRTSSEVLIMQRLHERDLAGHVLNVSPDSWTILCLPERYEPSHPFVWPDDPRSTDDLLCPERVGELEHEDRAKQLGTHRAAGQLQQRPAAREGAILKRDAWRFYPPQRRDETDQAFIARLPKFTAIWQSWDTSFRDGSQNDLVAGTVWGQHGADLYLLPEGRHVRMNLSGTKTAIRELHAWVEQRWPRLPHRVLVEATANGPDVVAELRHELRGIIATRPSVGAHMPAAKKTIRAEAASPALEAGNVYVPGVKDPNAAEGYDTARTPQLSQELVEQSAAFPNAEHDDLVDSFTQAVNYTRVRSSSRARIARPAGARAAIVPQAGSMAGY